MAKRVNLLEGNILSALTRLALPIMATSLVNMAYNMTDMIWIGRVGPGPVAAVGAAGMYMWLSQGLSLIHIWCLPEKFRSQRYPLFG